MQEFFLKICANRFRVLGQWRGLTEEWRESIEPYFAVILKNVIHDYRRQNLSRWHHVEEWYDEEGRRQIGLNDLEDLQVAAHRVMAYEESRAALWRCIERLSDRLRRVVRLYISELPHEEIASSLGIAVNASRARLHRAIKALETCLRQAGHNELSFESV
jgi:RNA polymerase sigma factor (sigma-70 family)